MFCRVNLALWTPASRGLKPKPSFANTRLGGHGHQPRLVSTASAFTLQLRTFVQSRPLTYRSRDLPRNSPYDVARTYARARGIPPGRPKSKEDDTASHVDDLTLPVAFPGSPGGTGGAGGGGLFRMTRSPMLDAALTTIIGLGMVFMGGVGYLAWYKKNVLDKIEQAFSAGYDPALEVAAEAKKRYKEDDHKTLHLRRKEQDIVDRIIGGQEIGHYFMLLGAKGTGKTTMIYDAMQSVDALGVSVCEAHPDLEVFRLRLGKALNYEFNEDSQTGLFQRRDPREAGAALDIERALNKLEKVALRAARKLGRPLVLVFNNVHFFQHTEEGAGILLQLQQRAEAWAESGIMTMVFSTDDYWPYSIMRKNGSRMQVLSVYDLCNDEAVQASHRMRRSAGQSLPPESTIQHALNLVGGRLSYINKVSKAEDMVQAAETFVDDEREWMMSVIGLIEDCDDDVMDEQKWSSCSWLLLREFVKQYKENEETRLKAIEAGELNPDSKEEFFLPSIPYGQCRQIMTRTDFLNELDRQNIISIDVHHNVRPDSMLVLQAAREVVESEGFDELLDSVRDRIDEIEGLHRTRELTFKDLQKGDVIKLRVDKGGDLVVD